MILIPKRILNAVVSERERTERGHDITVIM